MFRAKRFECLGGREIKRGLGFFWSCFCLLLLLVLLLRVLLLTLLLLLWVAAVVVVVGGGGGGRCATVTNVTGKSGQALLARAAVPTFLKSLMAWTVE